MEGRKATPTEATPMEGHKASPMEGHKALLVDMGYSSIAQPATSEMRILTWEDVHMSREHYCVSLLLVVGAPKLNNRKTIVERDKYFPGWIFENVTNLAANMICARDPTVWNQPSDCETVLLGNNRNAASIHLDCKDGEAFQLLLTKLFNGTNASNHHLSAGMAEGCWQNLIKSAVKSKRWIITGNLRECNRFNMVKRFECHTDRHVRELSVGVATNESETFVVAASNMAFAITQVVDEAQSMIISMHSKKPSESSVQLPVSNEATNQSEQPTEPSGDSKKPLVAKNARTDSGSAPRREHTWISMCAEASDTEQLSQLLFLPRGRVMQDKEGITWEYPTELKECADKLETALKLIRDAREHARNIAHDIADYCGATRPTIDASDRSTDASDRWNLLADPSVTAGHARGATSPTSVTADDAEFSEEQFNWAKAWLEDQYRNSCAGEVKVRKFRSQFRAFIKQTVGDFAFAMHLLRHGIDDSANNLNERFLYVQKAKDEAKANIAKHRFDIPTRAKNPELFEQAREARRHYKQGEKLRMDIDNDKREYSDFNVWEQQTLGKYDDKSLYDKMVRANIAFGHGQGVEEHISAAKNADMSWIGNQMKRNREEEAPPSSKRRRKT